MRDFVSARRTKSPPVEFTTKALGLKFRRSVMLDAELLKSIAAQLMTGRFVIIGGKSVPVREDKYSASEDCGIQRRGSQIPGN